MSVQPHGPSSGGLFERLCLGVVLARDCQAGSLQHGDNYSWALLLGKSDLTACVSAESGSGRRSRNVRVCGLSVQLPNSSEGKVLILRGMTLAGPQWE